ncbi:HRDC domain-containing protein [Jatrophihabitans telluris]|uniref:HRDC domain-containing protein n=1 Tax=Jatrophihabitans telluris TaxID=2038343 RepID=A0ABY4QS84_9ACTN|nr:HRDC domain-containing protein [Jatrophihabitans telluris]UQX86690.1 HRDC domain-containing protein [Jatrophihabitans telluris]
MTGDVTPADAHDSASAETEPVLLRSPREGTPRPLTTAADLAEAVSRIAAGTGPVALDAERASGYRYSQRAYLVQLRRAGTGTLLIDPIALPDLSSVKEAIGDAEWILHAANQDLPCLEEIGLRPARLFDTELVGRLLGSERVALGTMLERYVGISLEKGHSAADWSTRPLPDSWLDYAALDVELLLELRDVLLAELEASGKLEWAAQECEAVRLAPPAPPRAEPWRRISGIHAIRNRRQLAIARAMWEARDRRAAERDIASGRVLPDAAIVAAIRANPKTMPELAALPVFAGPRQRQLTGYWFRALEAGRRTPEDELPMVSQPLTDPDAMPAPARWRDRDPAAAVRLAAVKDVVADTAERFTVVGQNLLAGDVGRRLAWRPPSPPTSEVVASRLSELGARPWQIDLLADGLAEALSRPVETTPTEAGVDVQTNDEQSDVQTNDEQSDASPS